MKKQFYSLFVFCVLMAVFLAFADDVAKQKVEIIPHTWEKDSSYVIDQLQQNVIVQLPVLHFTANNWASVYTQGRYQYRVCCMNAEQTKVREYNLPLPDASRYQATETESKKTIYESLPSVRSN